MLRTMRALTRLVVRSTIVSFVIALATAGSAFGQTTTAAGGGAFTLIVKSDGSLWVFGLNNNGQIGDNSTTTRKSPQPVSGLANITAVAAGGVHAMALTSAGALYAWGDNLYGQVGDSTPTDRKTPVLLSLSNVTAIAAGEFHSLALTSSGDLYGWGRNNFGQIGNGNTTNVNTPTLVLTGVVAIGAGRNHSLAVKSDGSAWAWGANGSGQLGTNTTSTGATSTPVQMLSVSGASTIVGGEAHSLIVLSDGTVKGVGENGAGQLGDSTPTDRWVAVTVGAFSNVAQVVSGLDHAFARLTDNSVWGWGENTTGELGLGANVLDQRSPVEITGLTNIAAIAAGWNHSISVDTTGVVSTWGAECQQSTWRRHDHTTLCTDANLGGELRLACGNADLQRGIGHVHRRENRDRHRRYRRRHYPLHADRRRSAGDRSDGRVGQYGHGHVVADLEGAGVENRHARGRNRQCDVHAAGRDTDGIADRDHLHHPTKRHDVDHDTWIDAAIHDRRYRSNRVLHGLCGCH